MSPPPNTLSSCRRSTHFGLNAGEQPDFEGNPPGRIGTPPVGFDPHDKVVALWRTASRRPRKRTTVPSSIRRLTEMLGSNRSCRRHRRQRRASVVRRRVLSLVHDVLIDSASEAPFN
ncbi:MAG: hypothetical protein EOR95_32230 [Mesorhizobium sp.]|nr:MAG: hypothetical protein EOR95_32230 [Mesorhizobium sp.]